MQVSDDLHALKISVGINQPSRAKLSAGSKETIARTVDFPVKEASRLPKWNL